MSASSFVATVIDHFGFLASRFGYQRSNDERADVRFSSARIYFSFSANERDGLDIYFGRLNCFEPDGSPESLDLGTFVGALHTLQGTYTSLEDQSLELLAQGLLTHGRGLIIGDDRLYSKVRELRFWHVGQWVLEWGKSIQLTPTETAYHQALLREILRLTQVYAV